MAKTKTRYVCSNCGSAQPKWMGRCPDCGEWNTLVETIVQEAAPGRPPATAVAGGGAGPQSLPDIPADGYERIPVSIGELSRVLGGGIVFLAGYWLGFFGFLSRRFERQSDLFAARTVDCPGRRFEGACAMHRPESVAADDPYLVCGHQAWAFTSSLEQIALLNGMAARARSWRHFGIARRMRFIDDAVGRPDRVRRYDRRLRLLKWLILAAVLAATAAVAGLDMDFCPVDEFHDFCRCRKDDA